MADIVSKEVRSKMMSGIKGTDTRPEKIIRRGLHRKGIRYCLHDKRLPGKPDLVFPKYRAVIFTNGCFWHRHNCHLFKWPKSREDFWQEKISGNVERDKRNGSLLIEMGWRVGHIWECALKGRTKRPVSEILDECARWLKSNGENLVIQGYE